MNAELRIFPGNIVDLDVDAIVNAANRSLLGGGGVDGVIHKAAGPGLKEECRALGGCESGAAKITGGHDLKARFVIHTVGPVWKGGDTGEAELLAACYVNSLRLAEENRLRSIAFPAISTGAYGYPVEEAARIAVESVRSEAETLIYVEDIVFACMGSRSVRAHEAALKAR